LQCVRLVRASIAIIGSGFAGSILARVLARQGHRVVLLERGRHPRFAIGESSTPLAALALERLAQRFGFDDLDSLAAYGRWRRDLPRLRRGLKRGFTFYAHEPGAPYRNTERDERRLLVAASPNDEVADTHWLRADVDQHLALAATAAGVELLEDTDVSSVEPVAGDFRLELRRRSGSSRSLDVTHVIDGSGRGGVLARRFAAARRVPTAFTTTLLGAHVDGITPFDEVALARGAVLGQGPYPDHFAAVHHLLPDGWVYVLPFDHGVASIGLVAWGAPPPGALDDPQGAFHRAIGAYPPLAESLAGARVVVPFQVSHPLPHRSRDAAGEGWALLPHTYAFYDPLFSAGIAWSLLAVERLADWGEALRDGDRAGAQSVLDRYRRLLEREADHLEALLFDAWRALLPGAASRGRSSAERRFDRFVAQTLLYFAAASFSEARQRLVPERAPRGGWAWSGFLGATDRRIAAWPSAASRGRGAAVLDAPSISLAAAIATIEPRNVAGLGDSAFGRRVPIDLEALVRGARKLGLTQQEARRRARRLRGWKPASPAAV
jgi:FADH2 O2-dependent halogenase